MNAGEMVLAVALPIDSMPRPQIDETWRNKGATV